MFLETAPANLGGDLNANGPKLARLLFFSCNVGNVVLRHVARVSLPHQTPKQGPFSNCQH